MNKTSAVLEHLRTHRGITTYEAFQNYGATRLSDIVYRLRHQGHKIVTVNMEEDDRYGNRIVFAEYRLAEKGEAT